MDLKRANPMVFRHVLTDLIHFVNESVLSMPFLFVWFFFNPPVCWNLFNVKENVPLQFCKCFVLTPRSVIKSGSLVVNLLQTCVEDTMFSLVWVVTCSSLQIKIHSCPFDNIFHGSNRFSGLFRTFVVDVMEAKCYYLFLRKKFQLFQPQVSLSFFQVLFSC